MMELSAERVRLQAALGKVKGEQVQQGFLSEFDALAAEHAAATDKTSVEARIIQLQRHVALAGQKPSDWSLFSILLISGVTLGFFLSLWAYFGFLGPDRYASISTTRPVLVLTLIICMLGFGGLLIVRSLFTAEPAEAFERRFRLAREVFLVFAGIFGTIIGFYFGAADDDAPANVPSVEVTATQGLKIEATVKGGHAPFTGTLTLANNGGKVAMSGEERSLSATLAATQCPAEATLVLFDVRGRRADDKIDQDRAALRKLGWACPEPAGEGENTTTDNAGENRASDANTAGT